MRGSYTPIVGLYVVLFVARTAALRFAGAAVFLRAAGFGSVVVFAIVTWRSFATAGISSTLWRGCPLPR